MIHGALWIGGEATPPATRATFDVVAPADGVPIGTAADADGADIDRAVRAASIAAGPWATAAPADRERILLRAADLVEAHGDDRLLGLLVDESGSTVRKARFELDYTASLLRTAAGESRRLYGDTFPNDDPARMSMVFREPLGVVAAISPFNAPLALLAKMAAFPLAVGNTVVCKPSEHTPLIALELARLLHEAGLPPGALNVVTGGAIAGRALVAHAAVAGIAFTGSTAVGIDIAKTAAERMCRVQLELGGNNALIVLADADPEAAARIAADGAFAHAGQICMANSRIIVEASIADAFAEALAVRARQLHLGDLRDERTDYGPLIDERARARVEGHVADAVAGGAVLATGGVPSRGLTYEPTVLIEPARDSSVWREETFGPVVSVISAPGLDAAIDAANDSDYGLSAAVVTRDIQRGMACARRIRAGAVHVGMHSFQTNALAPVGGIGASGTGRSGGKYSTEQFTELKWVSVEVASC